MKRQALGLSLLGLSALIAGASLAVWRDERLPSTVEVSSVPKIILHTENSDWRTFICTQGSEIVESFSQAKAEFVSREGDMVHWRIYVKGQNHPTDLQTNANNIVCGYMN